MKIHSVLLFVSSLLLAGQTSFAEPQATPVIDQAALDQLAETNPDAYEIYRQYQAVHAATYEEFLNWATPKEIADDLGIDLENQLPIENAGSALVQVNVYLGKPGQSYMTMATPTGSITDNVRGTEGRPGNYHVPHGCFPAVSMDKNHHSSLFHNAPMPNSVFFSGNSALHAGSMDVPSHGCIHLNYATSLAVFNAVLKYGRANTSICVH